MAQNIHSVRTAKRIQFRIWLIRVIFQNQHNFVISEHHTGFSGTYVLYPKLKGVGTRHMYVNCVLHDLFPRPGKLLNMMEHWEQEPDHYISEKMAANPLSGYKQNSDWHRFRYEFGSIIILNSSEDADTDANQSCFFCNSSLSFSNFYLSV